MQRSRWLFGLLTLSLLIWSPQQVAADWWKDESGQGKYRYETKEGKYNYEYKEEYKRDKYGYKYTWKDGDCKYEYKEDKHGYKEKRKCEGGPSYAWAPAHGYRAQFPDIDGGYCDRGLPGSQLAGIAAGGALGGFLGSKIGKGSGQLAATAAGALLGAFIGSEIAYSMDSRDQACVSRSLEGASDNQTVTWRNPDTNADYRVTPVKSYDDTSGRYCREYITEATMGGKVEQVYGTACYQPDGSWELVS